MNEFADRENPTKAVVLEGAPEGYVRLGGYGVVFGGKDLQGETFEADTDFWLDKLTRTPPALYQHGKDAKIKKARLGHATIADPDDIGLWTEMQFALADKYTAAIMSLAGKGKLGLSSGTAGHLAERQGSKITSWPIVEMSLTPTPAEPRTLGVHEIRSLLDFEPAFKGILPQDGGEPSADAESAGAEAITIAPSDPIVVMEANKMAEEERVVQATPEPSMKDLIQAAVSEVMKAMPGYDKALRDNPEQADRPEEKSFGDFLVAVQRRDIKRLNSVYKAALAEGAGETGGYAVPPEYSNSILTIAAQQSVVRPYGPQVIPMQGKEFNVPALDYTGSTAGRDPVLGGMYASFVEEAAVRPEIEPTFKTIKLIARALSGYTLASNEVMADEKVGLESLLRRLFADAVTMAEDWHFINGTGAGQPLGVLKASCLATEVAATSTFVLSDAASMIGKFKGRTPTAGVWLIHPAVVAKLIALTDGTASGVIWIPNARESLPMTMFGKPVVITDRMPVMPASTGATQIGGVLLADWSYYLIGDRGGLEIAFSSDYAFTTNQSAWRFTKRVDGQPWLSQAVYYADGASTWSPFVSLVGS